jgi:hypothetical protein
MSVRNPPPTGHLAEPEQAEGDEGEAARQDRLEPEPGDELATEGRRDDDRHRQR